MDVSSILVSVALALGVVPEPPASAPIPGIPKWVTVGEGPNTIFEVLTESYTVDLDTASAFFVMRTTYKKEITPAGKHIKFVVEPTTVLCESRTMVTNSYTAYDPDMKPVNTSIRAKVYADPGLRGTTITELIRFACGLTYQQDLDMQKPVTPGTVTFHPNT